MGTTWARLTAVCLSLGSLACGGHRWEAFDLRPRSSAIHADDRAVVLLAETEVRFLAGISGSPVADVRTRERIRYLDSAASVEKGVVALYAVGFSQVLSLRARVIAPNGSTHELDASRAADVSVNEGSLISDSRARYLALPAVPEGAVVEYEYTVRHFHPRLIQFTHAWVDQRPVVQSSFNVRYPHGWAIDSHWTGGRPANVRTGLVRESEGQWLKSYSRADVRAVHPEPYGPGVQGQPRVSVRLNEWVEQGQHRHNFRNPEELSRFVYELASTTAEPSLDMKAKVQKLLASVPDVPEAKARALHAYVCDAVQYCAIELGMGGWKPENAADVFRQNFGDCKGKANLLRSLLAVAGIPSRLALIYAHNGHPRPFSMPTLGANFNHMILMVDLPSGTVFTDPTAREIPFGELPAGDLDAEVLPLAPQGTALVRTPQSTAKDATETWVIEASLDDRGRGKGTFHVEAAGGKAAWLREIARSTTERQERVLKQSLGLPQADVDGWTFEGVERGSSALKVHGNVVFSSALQWHGGLQLLRPSQLYPSPVPVLVQDKRRSAFALYEGRTYRSVMTLKLPEGMTVDQVPSPVQIDSAFGTFKSAWTTRLGVLVWERQYILQQRSVSAENYLPLKAFFDAILATDNRPAVLSVQKRAER